jgi:hypothetical protein
MVPAVTFIAATHLISMERVAVAVGMETAMIAMMREFAVISMTRIIAIVDMAVPAVVAMEPGAGSNKDSVAKPL